MSRLLLCLAFAFPSFAVAQEDDARFRGDSLRLAGDLSGAVEAYRSAWTGGEDGAIAFALASTFALQPQFADSAFHYLALSDEDSMRPLWDADFYPLVADVIRWKSRGGGDSSR